MPEPEPEPTPTPKKKKKRTTIKVADLTDPRAEDGTRVYELKGFLLPSASNFDTEGQIQFGYQLTKNILNLWFRNMCNVTEGKEDLREPRVSGELTRDAKRVAPMLRRSQEETQNQFEFLYQFHMFLCISDL